MVDGTFLVIGAGSIGKRHTNNLAAMGQNAELIPYRHFDADAVSRRTDITGVVIATATPIRMELIALCAKNGWPFYVEKPLAWTTDQVEALFEAATPVAHRSVIGFMMRYHPALRALANMDLSDGYRFDFEIGHDVRQWRANWSFADSYASNQEGGGVLLDLCHELDMVHCLFPQATVDHVACHGHAAFSGVDFATLVELSGASGPAGTVAMDYLSPVSLRQARLRGTGRVVDIDWLACCIRAFDGAAVNQQHFEFDRNDMFLSLMSDFVALASGAEPSDNPLLPRFDKMRSSCDLIANAWNARHFVAEVDLAFD